MTRVTQLWPAIHIPVLLVGTVLWGGCEVVPQVQAPAGVVSNIPRQDGVCSVPGGLNQDACAIDCCDAHDRCYSRTGCNALSWLTGGLTPECLECNTQVLSCLGQECTPQPADVPVGVVACEASVDCPGALICTDPTCSGEGRCYAAWSGEDGDCCNNPVDCRTGMCVEGRCVVPDQRVQGLMQLLRSAAQVPHTPR